MVLTIVYILLNIVSIPSILLVGPIFLAPLATSSNMVLQGRSHLVSFFGVVARWSGVFLVAGYSLSPAVFIVFDVPLFLVSCLFLGVCLGLYCV